MALFFRDASVVPANAEALEEITDYLEAFAAAVARGRPRRKTVRAAIGHALEFDTWRSLERTHGLSRAQAVDAMARFVASS